MLPTHPPIHPLTRFLAIQVSADTERPFLQIKRTKERPKQPTPRKNQTVERRKQQATERDYSQKQRMDWVARLSEQRLYGLIRQEKTKQPA